MDRIDIILSTAPNPPGYTPVPDPYWNREDWHEARGGDGGRPAGAGGPARRAPGAERVSKRKAPRGGTRIACKRCGKPLRPLATGDIGGPSMPAHKCPHRKKCDRWVIACDACNAVSEAKPEVLEPPCVFCNPPGSYEERLKRWKEAGACASSVWMLDPPFCKACFRGTKKGDPALLAALRAGTVSVWSTR